MGGLFWRTRRLARTIPPCMGAFAVAFVAGDAPSLAVPWREQDGQTIVWLNDNQLSAAISGRAIPLDHDSTGQGGYCYGPLNILGYGAAPNGARLTVATCRRATAAKDCTNLAGSWHNTIHGMGQTVWTLRSIGNGRYAATEAGLGNATGTAFLSGNTLVIDFKTGIYVGRYQWPLDRQCTAGRGTLTFSAGRRDSFSTSVRRQ